MEKPRRFYTSVVLYLVTSTANESINHSKAAKYIKDTPTVKQHNHQVILFHLC